MNEVIQICVSFFYLLLFHLLYCYTVPKRIWSNWTASHTDANALSLTLNGYVAKDSLSEAALNSLIEFRFITKKQQS